MAREFGLMKFCSAELWLEELLSGELGSGRSAQGHETSHGMELGTGKHWTV